MQYLSKQRKTYLNIGKKIILTILSFLFMFSLVSHREVIADDGQTSTYYTIELTSTTKTGDEITNGVAQISGLPIGGRVEGGKEYSFTAYDNEVYTFAYWKVDGSKVSDSTNVLTRSYNKDTKVEAVFSLVGSNKSVLTVTGKKVFTVKTASGSEVAVRNPDTRQYEYNKEFDNLTSIELIYDDKSGDFVSWSSLTGSVLSSSANYGFNINQDTDIKLNIFGVSNGSYLGEFYSTSEKLLYTTQFGSIEELLSHLPEKNPSKLGYKFDSWLLPDGKKLSTETTMEDIGNQAVDSKIYFSPSYVKEAINATITIINKIDDKDSSPITKTCAVGQGVDLKADTIDNTTFMYWAILEDDTYITLSTNSTYSMHVSGDKTIYAVYSTVKEREEKASISVTGLLAEADNRIFFEVSRSVPTSLKLTEQGILYSTKSFSNFSPKQIDDAIKLNDNLSPKTNVTKQQGKDLGYNNSYGLHINIKTNFDKTLYLRGYIVVDGEILYTKVYVVSYNSIIDNNYTIIDPDQFNNAQITYLNENGEKATITVPANTSITFSEGENGTYGEANPGPLTLESEQVFEIPESYYPTPNTDYEFVGFRYDTTNHIFIAQYNKLSSLPKVGEIITLNDGKKYKVLSINGSVAKVFAMYDDKKMNYNSNKHVGLICFGLVEGDDMGIPYQDSDVDKYLEKTWYPSLNKNDATKPMYEAIQSISYKQNMYEMTDLEPSPDLNLTAIYQNYYSTSDRQKYYIKGGFYSKDVGSRHAYLLDLKDVIDYIGKDNIYPNTLSDMFYESEEDTMDGIWLSSVPQHQYYYHAYTFTPDKTNGHYIYYEYVDGANYVVRQAFVIDLRHKGVEYEIKIQDAKITYTDENNEEKTIEIPSGIEISFDAGDNGKYNTTPPSITLFNGQSVDLTKEQYIPTANDGYEFVGFKYDDVNHKFVAQYNEVALPEATIMYNCSATEEATIKVPAGTTVHFDSGEHGWYEGSSTRKNKTLSAGEFFGVTSDYYPISYEDGYDFAGFKYDANTFTFTVQYIEVSLPDATVTYIDETGKTKQVTVPANTIITFNAGNYGTLPTDLDKIKVPSGEVIDLTGDNYKAAPNSGYSFVGYKYDATYYTFTAQYREEVVMPKVGDIITLNDEEDYRVIKVEGNNATVFAMRNLANVYCHNTDHQTQFGDQDGIQYKDSNIDTYLEQTWYGALGTFEPEMYNAIIPVSLEQHMYKKSSKVPSGDYLTSQISSTGSKLYIIDGYTSVTVGERHVYLLDFKDVVDYIGKDNFDLNSVKEMFYNTNSVDGPIWLASAVQGYPEQAWRVGATGDFTTIEVNYDGTIRPSFVIDLGAAGITFTIKDAEPKIIYIDETGLEKQFLVPAGTSISFSAGEHGTLPEGLNTINLESKQILDLTESQYTPTANEGYEFVGFKYDKTHHSFTAQYKEKVVMPVKGDSITLNDGKRYRVLSINGNEARVTALYNCVGRDFNTTSRTIQIGNSTVQQYKDSTIDNYLEKTWYAELATSQPAMYEAIVPTNVVQKAYVIHDGHEPSNDNYFIKGTHISDGNSNKITPYYITESQGEAVVGERHVFALSLQDIKDCLGRDGLTNEKVTQTFFGYNRVSRKNERWIRMISVAADKTDYSITLSDANGGFLYSLAVNYHVPEARPTFVIDLGNSNIHFTIDQIDPKAYYLDETGTEKRITIPNNVEISFDKGEHGSYSTDPEPFTLTYNQEIDLTLDKYKPTAAPGYIYVGYKYNETTHVFTAQYKVDVVMPNVGDIIIFEDGFKYRVLEVNGKRATVFGLYDVKTMEFHEDGSYIHNFDGENGIRYDSSNIDNYLEKTWYGTEVSSHKTMHDAIVEKEIVQYMYEYIDGEPVNGQYYARFGKGYFSNDVRSYYIGRRHAFLLDLKDIVNYLGKDFTEEQILEMFYDSSSDVPTTSQNISLTSACKGQSSSNFNISVNNSGNIISAKSATEYKENRVAFVINLDYPDLEFTIKPNDPKVIYKDRLGNTQEITLPIGTEISFDDGEYGTLPTDLGPITLEGNQVLDLTEGEYVPTPNEGCEFIGYIFDSSSNKFIAKYSYNPVMPEKGDVITLNDGKSYKVLKTEGNEAFVLGLYLGYSGAYHDNSNYTIDFGGVQGTRYEGSTVDKRFEEWYGGLATSQPAMHDAIVEQNIKQYMYDFHKGDAGSNQYVAKMPAGYFSTDVRSVDVGMRHVYLLDLQDIIDYVGQDFTQDFLHEMYYEKESDVPVSSAWISLASDWKGYNGPMMYQSKDDTGYIISAIGASDYRQMRYSFVIDLGYSDVHFTIKAIDPQIKYTDETGEVIQITVPVGTTISVDGGDHGTLPEEFGSITLKSKQVINLNDNKYKPTVDPGYEFVGFRLVDDSTYKFSAVYNHLLPNKGEVITLNDGNDYKVLSITDSNAELLAMYNASTSVDFNDPITTTKFNGYEGPKYENSELDKFLNDTFYNALPTVMKNAIIDQDITQYMYKVYYEPDDTENFNVEFEGNTVTADYKSQYASNNSYWNMLKIGGVHVGDRHVYAPDLSTIYNHYGKNIISSEELIRFFYNQNTNPGDDYTLWFSSADAPSDITSVSNFVWVAQFHQVSMLATHPADRDMFLKKYAIRPVFVINLNATGVNYELASNDPKISYINEEGLDKTIKVKTGTTVKFSQGDKGNYSNAPQDVTLAEKQILDITGDDYKPTPNHGYSYDGYKYDEDSHTFTAQYSLIVPKKGETIVLDDDREYKVIGVDGTKLKVLAMYDVEARTFSDNSGTFDFGVENISGIKYEGSNVDTYLNGTFYESLPDSMKNTIVDQDIKQIMYRYSDNPNSALTYETEEGLAIKYKYESNYNVNDFDNLIYVGEADSISRHVFEVSIDDIYDYFEDEVITSNELNELFFNQKESISSSVWLSNASYSSSNQAWGVNGSRGMFSTYTATRSTVLRPAFVIDIGTEEFIVDINATVIYKDKNGTTQKAIIKPGTTIKFDAGDHGSYYGPSSITLTDSQVIDIANDFQYSAYGNQGYSYAGYLYDESTHTFIAQYIQDMPKVGNIIKLNDGNNYRVLSINGTEAKLLALYSPKVSAYNTKSVTTSVFGGKGQKYNGSLIDKYLTGEWFNSLDNGNSKPIHDAIIAKTVYQNLYELVTEKSDREYVGKINDSFFYADNGYNRISVASRNAGALGLQDIVDYFGGDNLTPFKLSELFYNTPTLENPIWLSSAVVNDATQALTVNNKESISPASYDREYGVNPSFTINLAGDDIVFELQEVNAAVSYLDAQDGTVKAIELPKGTVITINAGDHGTFTGDSNTITLANGQIVDLSDAEYACTPIGKYEFTGFIYDENNHIFTAQYYKTGVTPSVGDIVTLNDGKDYLVLKVNDPNITVVAMQDVAISQFNDGNSKYENSKLDNQLEGVWYSSLEADEVTKPMHDAIQYVNVTQKTYEVAENDSELTGDIVAIANTDSRLYFAKDKKSRDESFKRHVYALSLEDIVAYLGHKEISASDIINMLFLEDNEANDVWLSSAVSTQGGPSCAVSANADLILRKTDIHSESGVRPMFVINLDGDGVTCDFKKLGTKIYYPEGNNHSTYVWIPSDANVTFNAGPRGHYDTEPTVTLVDKQIISLDTNEYKPIVDDGYKFNGFIYDEDSYTFTAKYQHVLVTMPDIGDIVTLDGKDYKVIDTGGNIARLFAMFNASSDRIPYNEDETRTTLFGGEYDGIIYEGSFIDDYIEKEWYPSLPESIRNAIIPNVSYQNMYSTDENRPEDDDYVGKFTVYYSGGYQIDKYIIGGYPHLNVPERHVTLLDVQEVADYLGKDNINRESVIDMFYGDVEITTGTIQIWLSSAYSNQFYPGSAWIVWIEPTDGYISSNSADSYGETRPVFNIDLSDSELDFTVKSNKVPVTYMNMDAVEEIINIRIGTEVFFSAGEHGHYNLEPGSITITAGQIYNITGDKYRPESDNENYRFMGYSYDEDSHTFIAQYKFSAELPVKGDIIKLNDGKKYRVLSINGTEAKLLAMYDTGSPIKYNETSSTSTLDFGGAEKPFQLYENSTLDKYLNDEFASTMPDAIKNAIIPQNITQYVYYAIVPDFEELVPTLVDEYGFKFVLRDDGTETSYYCPAYPVCGEERMFFTLGIEDLADYFDDKVNTPIITRNKIKELYSVNGTLDKDIWLSSSAFGNNIDKCPLFYIDCSHGTISDALCNQSDLYARPAFVIDLAAEGVTFKTDKLVLPQKGDIITLNNNGLDYRVLSINNTTATLLSMQNEAELEFNKESNAQYDSYHKCYSQVYQYSGIDMFLRDGIYETLDNDPSQVPIYNAIVSKQFNQQIISLNDYPNNSMDFVDEYAKTVNYKYLDPMSLDYQNYVTFDRTFVDNVPVRLLNIEDIYNYFGQDIKLLTFEQTQNFFYSDNEFHETKPILLATAVADQTGDKVLAYSGSEKDAGFRAIKYDDRAIVRPVFTIDLSGDGLDFEIKEIETPPVKLNAQVSYKSTTGATAVAQAPVGSTVKFDAGKHGSYSGTAPSIKIETNTSYSALDNAYYPNVDAGYTFVGFAYSSATQVFVAKYKNTSLPSKGDIITLNDNRKYRVLSIDGNEAKVLTLTDYTGSSYSTEMYRRETYLNPDGSESHNSTISYKDSTIDKYINNTWYKSLGSDEQTKPIKNAIMQKDFKQDVYIRYTSPNDDISYVTDDGREITYKSQSYFIDNNTGNYKSNYLNLVYDGYTNVGDRYAYQVTLSDMYDYFGTKILSSNQIEEFLYGSIGGHVNRCIWFASGDSSYSTEMSTGNIKVYPFYVLIGDEIYVLGEEEYMNVRPTFTIDLSYDGVLYDIINYGPREITMPNKGDVITLEGKDYRVLSTDGTKAKLLAQYDVEDIYYEYGSTQIESFDGNNGRAYEGSAIDEYLNNDFYSSSLSTNIQDAIVPQQIVQHLYTYSDVMPDDNNYVAKGINEEEKTYYLAYSGKGVSISDRKVFALDVKDIVDYMGSAICAPALDLMFYGDENANGDSWLRSSVYDADNHVFYLDSTHDCISYSPNDGEYHSIHPAFVIDLAHEGINFTVKQTKPTIEMPSVGDVITLNDNKQYRVLEVEDTRVKLLAQYSVNNTRYDGSNTDFGTRQSAWSGEGYNNSRVYKYLEKTWYEEIDPILHNAIYYRTMPQYMYSYKTSEQYDGAKPYYIKVSNSSDDDSIYIVNENREEVYDRNVRYHAFILGIEDIVKYLGNEASASQIADMFCSGSTDNDIWLSSAMIVNNYIPEFNPYVACVSNTDGIIYKDGEQDTADIHPAFILDLAYPGVTYTSGTPEPGPTPVVEIPEKGDVVTLNDGLKYRVLDVKGNEAKLLALESIGNSVYADRPTTGFEPTMADFGGGNKAVKYKDSKLDKYIEETWYEGLKTTKPEIYNAIQKKTVYQYAYDPYTTEAQDNYALKIHIKTNTLETDMYITGSYTSQEIGERHACALGIQDIIGYLGDSITQTELDEMVNSTDLMTYLSSGYIYDGKAVYNCYYLYDQDGQHPMTGGYPYYGEMAVKPVFYINLLSEGLSCVIDKPEPVEIEMPEVGDIIILNDDKEYRVLSTDGNNAKLVAMYNLPQIAMYDEGGNETVDFGTKSGSVSGPRYKDSKVDKYLEETWYGNLDETMKGAIVPIDLVQKMYRLDIHDPDREDNIASFTSGVEPYLLTSDLVDGYTPVSVGSRHVYPLDIQDVVDYVGTNITPDLLSKMFCEDKIPSGDVTIWLSSAYDGTNTQSTKSMFTIKVSSTATTFYHASSDYSYYVRPSFVMDLSHKGIEFIVKGSERDVQMPGKGDIITLNDGNDYRVLSINGNHATVMSLSDSITSQYNLISKTTKMGATDYQWYNLSTLDINLTSWYSSLGDDEVTKPMHDAILPEVFNQNIYTYFDEPNTKDDFPTSDFNHNKAYKYEVYGSNNQYDNLARLLGTLTIENHRSVRELTINDLYDYYGTDVLSCAEIQKFFFNTENDVNATIWLADSVDGQVDGAWAYNGSSNKHSFVTSTCTETHVARPVFKIDLSHEGVNFEVIHVNPPLNLIKKGSVIALNDGKRYKVLDINGSNAKLLSLENVGGSKYYAQRNDVTTPFDGGTEGLQYEGSLLDKFITENWLVELHSSHPEIYNAIIPQDLVQRLYSYDYEHELEDYTLKETISVQGQEMSVYFIYEDSKDVGQRYAYALDLQDIIDYIGGNVLTQDNVIDLFEPEEGDEIGLASTVPYSDEHTEQYVIRGGEQACLLIDAHYWNLSVRPVFYINLNGEGVKYGFSTAGMDSGSEPVPPTPVDDMPEVGDIIKLSDGKEYRVLSTEGNNAKVVALFDDKNMKYDAEGSLEYIGSDLDKYLENTWYKNFNDTTQKAIVEQEITQRKYIISDKVEDNEQYARVASKNVYGVPVYQRIYKVNDYTPQAVESRHVFALDVKDIVDYFGNEISTDEVVEFFSSTDKLSFSWLSSAVLGIIGNKNYENAGALYSGNALSFSAADTEAGVRPAFVINLAYPDLEYEVVKKKTLSKPVEKGDIVKLYDADYRVLDIVGTKAKLVALDDVTTMYYDEEPVNSKYSNPSYQYEYTLYKDSDLDNYLENEWYEGLNEPMKSAIVPQNFFQHLCRSYYEEPEKYVSQMLMDDGEGGIVHIYFDYVSNRQVGSRHVFELNVSDVLQYFGEEANSKDVRDLFKISDIGFHLASSMTIEDEDCWYNGLVFMEKYSGLGVNPDLVVGDEVLYAAAEDEFGVRPAFVIDLAYEGISYTIVE